MEHRRPNDTGEGPHKKGTIGVPRPGVREHQRGLEDHELRWVGRAGGVVGGGKGCRERWWRVTFIETNERIQVDEETLE